MTDVEVVHSMAALRNTSTESITRRAKITAAIRQIPRGMVSTYGAIARAAGFGRGARQVAAVLRTPLGLPWHRVLGAGGEIKLRGNSAFEQRFRLEAEGVVFRGRRVDMSRHEYKFHHKKVSKAKRLCAVIPISGMDLLHE